ncbi:MAG: hypothetical protein QM820_26920 [Minicystis sp.]
MRTLLLLTTPFLLLACRSGDSPAPAGSAAPSATTAATAPRPTVSAAPSASPTASAASSAAPSTAPSATAAPSSAAAAEASEAPTSEEWQAAKEVNVVGLTALGCETKRVREWVGVFCAKPNEAQGTPVKVKVEKAETLHTGAPAELRRDVKITSAEGKTTLVARFVPGTDVEATFTWTDKEKRLVLWWPADKPEPRFVGSFK